MEDVAPITYSTLHAYQLPQINDLLERVFWHGINGKPILIQSYHLIQLHLFSQ